MELKEIFNKAYESYRNLTSMVKAFYDAALVKMDQYPYSYKETMGQIDVYIQGLLVGVAASDGDVTEDEANFIANLPDYGSMFNDGSLKTGTSKEMINGMAEFAKKNSENIPPVLQMISHAIDKDKKDEFVQLIISLFLDIFKAFGVFDGRFSKAEAESVKQLLSPLINVM